MQYLNRTVEHSSENAIKLVQTFRSARLIIYTVSCSSRHFVASEKELYLFAIPKDFSVIFINVCGK